MKELVRLKPGLFLHKICEKLYDSTKVLLSTAGVHRNLVKRLSITLKNPKTKNIQKSLVAKYSFMEWMEFYPAKFLVFTGVKRAFCDKDLRSLARSPRGTPLERFLVNQNAAPLSLLPAILTEGLVTLTTTFKMFTGRQFKHFLKFYLVIQSGVSLSSGLPLTFPYYQASSNEPLPQRELHCFMQQRYITSRQTSSSLVQCCWRPTYCPELNPIELGFAAIKQELQASQILTRSDNPEWDIV
ncbi:hypothetical protein PTTG_05983 [Puccinia triticina 1-1 BBBD Race 1]|uniref:Tc1-like transposase DDE domain-containing protein n=1 Tax=Puccinia triticina (isolate 1-1 / race 1 (BBBD)) TaxID=630390 RepID=A0A0C4EYS8_PUCT1|nr:hypothetical protein PTTG_05983 [Puccinia triticina 1-1 BBBD Race 1]